MNLEFGLSGCDESEEFLYLLLINISHFIYTIFCYVLKPSGVFRNYFLSLFWLALLMYGMVQRRVSRESYTFCRQLTFS